MPDANLDKSIGIVSESCYGCAGERCLAGSIVVTVGKSHGDVRERLVAAAKSIRVGDGVEPASRWARSSARARGSASSSYIEKGIAEGAELLLDGRGHTVKGRENGFFLGPTVFDKVNPKSSDRARGDLRARAVAHERAGPRRRARAPPRAPAGERDVDLHTSGKAARDVRDAGASRDGRRERRRRGADVVLPVRGLEGELLRRREGDTAATASSSTRSRRSSSSGGSEEREENLFELERVRTPEAQVGGANAAEGHRRPDPDAQPGLRPEGPAREGAEGRDGPAPQAHPRGREEGRSDPRAAGDLQRPVLLPVAGPALVRRRRERARAHDRGDREGREEVPHGGRRARLRARGRGRVLQHRRRLRLRRHVPRQVPQEPHPAHVRLLGEVLLQARQHGLPGLPDALREGRRLHLLRPPLPRGRARARA